MLLPAVLDRLGYSTSGNFLRRGTTDFGRAPDIGHILRAAAHRDACRLEGVYALRPFDNPGSQVPIVYVCEADTVAAADEIHRLVWNQDIVPFLLVRTPAGLRLYSGFKCDDRNGGKREGLLEPLVQFNEIADRLAEFHADSIDSGEIWRKRGADVHPDKRVYWTLLENLKQLAKKFAAEFGTSKAKEVIHPLIGKYVYLYYLKDRGFLSDRRLAEWKIDHETVYGRTATLAGLRAICENLDSFLNGRVFPLNLRGASAPSEEQIQRIAGAFAGDTFGGGWQFHLPFTAFKFAFIPIETLSMIYEQFLHLPDNPESDDEDEHSEGRKAGAYYTPIPVVNYMLSEMDRRCRLQRGVRVFDPSCGSGAFLVQCYRRLIEREFVARKKKPTPQELSTLLKRHIFGVDMDEDACSVAEFSLYLTLLEYVEPSDLLEHPRFKLPTLRKKNIFKSDFFEFRPFKRKFHWALGNPPWKKLIGKKIELRDKRAMAWMQKHTNELPVGDNSLAQAFVWRCREFLTADGECGLLVPAMTLFEDFSQGFRRAFLGAHRLHAVANFSNLAEVLFARRSRVPAAALFFAPRRKNAQPDELEITTVFSPLVANQESTRPSSAGIRTETWSITVNGDEVRELPFCDIAAGSGLPWKLAIWGSGLDASLLARLQRKWPRLEDVEARWHSGKKVFVVSAPTQVFKVSEGLQLREKDTSDEVERVSAIAEKPVVDVVTLARYRRIFAFPLSSIPSLPKGKEYALKGRAKRPLTVCEAPHVVVSAARNFAVYSNKFIVVPPRQIGVVSVDNNRALLKALALYLSSDFAYYHQFLTATELGVKRDRATLESLRQIPIPLLGLDREQLAEWEDLHDRLAQTKPRLLPDSKQPDVDLDESSSDDGQNELVEELNRLVSEVLGLDETDRALVEDLIHVRLALNDGKVGRAAMQAATKRELKTYAEWFQCELAAALDDQRYSVTVLHDADSGFVAIEPAIGHTRVRVVAADSQDAHSLARAREQLREERSQWVYFDRALQLHRREKTYLFKPIHRMHWTRSRAMLDAADVAVSSIRAS
jgi:hypothetical protein